MEKKVILTGDGSKTIYLTEWNESYHSKHGALNEAQHVFINHGLAHFEKNELVVFELGFGTGLNAILAYRFAVKNNVRINYVGIEAYPVSIEMLNVLNYSNLLTVNENVIFTKMHEAEWEREVIFSELFTFRKVMQKIEDFREEKGVFDVIFFDAFGPRTQAHLWKPDILKKMIEMLRKNGVLTTYCAQGQFRRDLKSVGFTVVKLPGPPGKREMTKGIKP